MIAVAAVVFAVGAAILSGVFGLGLGLLGLAFGLAVTLGVLALVASPLILFFWLIWRLARGRPAAPMVVRDMTTALIADDERLLREQLRARLAEVWPELEIVAEAKNGAEAVALTEARVPTSCSSTSACPA